MDTRAGEQRRCRLPLGYRVLISGIFVVQRRRQGSDKISYQSDGCEHRPQSHCARDVYTPQTYRRIRHVRPVALYCGYRPLLFLALALKRPHLTYSPLSEDRRRTRTRCPASRAPGTSPCHCEQHGTARQLLCPKVIQGAPIERVSPFGTLKRPQKLDQLDGGNDANLDDQPQIVTHFQSS